MKVLELFAGIGACSKALKNLGIKVDYADVVEIDKYAIKSFNAVHGTDYKAQDITNIQTSWKFNCCKCVRGYL